MDKPVESKEKKIGHKPGKRTKSVAQSGKPLTIADLGWTEEQAAKIRAQLASFAEDWDDPAMDIYDEV